MAEVPKHSTKEPLGSRSYARARNISSWIATPFALLLFGKSVHVLVGPDEQDVLRDCRGGRRPLAQLWVFGHDLWLVGASFHDGYGAIVQGCEINVPIGGHRGGVILARRGDSLLV